MTGVPYPPRAREHRTRPLVEAFMEPHDDPDVDAAVERRTRLDELIRANAADAHYDEDDL